MSSAPVVTVNAPLPIRARSGNSASTFATSACVDRSSPSLDPHALPEVAVRSVDHENREILDRFRRALEALPAGEHAAFSLRHIEGLTLAEIAQATATSLATVKRRLQPRLVADRSAGDRRSPPVSVCLAVSRRRSREESQRHRDRKRCHERGPPVRESVSSPFG